MGQEIRDIEPDASSANNSHTPPHLGLVAQDIDVRQYLEETHYRPAPPVIRAIHV